MRIMMILGWQSLLWEILTTIMTMTMTGLVMINLLSLVITGSVEGVGGHNQTIRDCPDIHSDHHRCHPDRHQCHCHLHHLRHRWQGGSMHKFRICLRIKWECMHPHLILKQMRPMKWHNVTQSWNQWFLNHVPQKIFTFCPTTTCAGSRTTKLPFEDEITGEEICTSFVLQIFGATFRLGGKWSVVEIFWGRWPFSTWQLLSDHNKRNTLQWFTYPTHPSLMDGMNCNISTWVRFCSNKKYSRDGLFQVYLLL